MHIQLDQRSFITNNFCSSWIEKPNKIFKAWYHDKYTFNAPIGIVVIAEHQFAMFGAMYSMCLWVVTWQRSNSCSHLICFFHLFFFFSLTKAEQRHKGLQGPDNYPPSSRKVGKGFESCDSPVKPATVLHNIPKMCVYAFVSVSL